MPGNSWIGWDSVRPLPYFLSNRLVLEGALLAIDVEKANSRIQSRKIE
jgi:hypothetical protein